MKPIAMRKRKERRRWEDSKGWVEGERKTERQKERKRDREREKRWIKEPDFLRMKPNALWILPYLEPILYSKMTLLFLDAFYHYCQEASPCIHWKCIIVCSLILTVANDRRPDSSSSLENPSRTSMRKKGLKNNGKKACKTK